MKTTLNIQEQGDKLAIDLINGQKKASKFVRLVVDTHGINAAAIRDDVQALVDRHFSKAACSADAARLAAYASFRSAFTNKRLNSYLVDGKGGMLFISFKDPDGTPKDSKARFVTVDYKTPKQVENEAIQAARKESKAAAMVKMAQQEQEAEREILKASATAADIVKLLERRLPEITALTAVDIVAEWSAQLAQKAEHAAGMAKVQAASRKTA
jgi:hypothetical protein